jgi:hypothetical protein
MLSRILEMGSVQFHLGVKTDSKNAKKKIANA